MSALSIVGRYQDKITWNSIHGGSKRVELRPWRFNQVQDSGIHMIVARLAGLSDQSAPVFGEPVYDKRIGRMALGSGNVAWDSLPDPSTAEKDVTAVSLINETHSISIAPDDLSWLDTNGAPIATPSNRFGGTITIGVDVVGDLREFGLFGAYNNANSMMFNWVSHPLIQKDNSSTIERSVDITITIVRS